jgi:hypothetical protein
MPTNALQPTASSSSLEQQALVFYTSIKAKIIKRHGSPFVQDIPGKMGFSMQWFTKKGGHAVVNVLIREAYGGLRIEFTRNLVSGISDEVVHAEKPALNVQLNDGVWVMFNLNKDSAYIFGMFRANAQYSEDKDSERLVSELLGTLLQA